MDTLQMFDNRLKLPNAGLLPRRLFTTYQLALECKRPLGGGAFVGHSVEFRSTLIMKSILTVFPQSDNTHNSISPLSCTQRQAYTLVCARVGSTSANSRIRAREGKAAGGVA